MPSLHDRRRWSVALAVLLAGCSSDAASSSDAATSPAETDDGAEAGDATDGADSTGAASTTEAPAGEVILEERFDAADGSPWPSPWLVGSEAVLSSQVVDGQGSWRGATEEVARMLRPGVTATDVEATITVVFDQPAFQGLGVYVRHNGGVLEHTDPPGQGYAAYVESNGTAVIGVWHELDGVETLLLEAPVPSGPIQPGVPYQLRFQCRSEGDGTRLRARVWLAGEAEPAQWTVDHLDGAAPLQGTAGSFALDLYNYDGTEGVRVDDFVVRSL